MTSLRREILGEIERAGPLSFSRYMELALYHPGNGFYAVGGAGRRRDFITSPEVGPLFGALVARAIDGWWAAAGRPDHFVFVEVGAGPGTLARTVLRSELRCAGALEYVAVESSSAQRADHPADITSLASMPDRVEVGVIFGNELLDNLPFDILRYDEEHGWREIRVGGAGDRLVEVVVDTDLDPALVGVAIDGMRMPVMTRAGEWVARARATLGRGRVVVVDYAVPGHPVEPGRPWLRTFSDHGPAGDPLDGPGSKDITADVDLSQLRAVAEPASERLQADWLRRLGIDELVAAGLAFWDEHRTAPTLEAIEMRSRATEAAALLEPSGLGGFSVLEWVVDGSETGVTG